MLSIQLGKTTVLLGNPKGPQPTQKEDRGNCITVIAEVMNYMKERTSANLDAIEKAFHKANAQDSPRFTTALTQTFMKIPPHKCDMIQPEQAIYAGLALRGFLQLSMSAHCITPLIKEAKQNLLENLYEANTDRWRV